MKILVLKDNKAQDIENPSPKLYDIAGLVIEKQNGAERFYDNNDHFYKVACPVGTIHRAVISTGNKINLY